MKRNFMSLQPFRNFRHQTLPVPTYMRKRRPSLGANLNNNLNHVVFRPRSKNQGNLKKIEGQLLRPRRVKKIFLRENLKGYAIFQVEAIF